MRLSIPGTSVSCSLMLVVALLAVLVATAPLGAVPVGEEAPNFIVENVNGASPIILSDYRGEVVVLNFFWTG